MQQPEHKNRSLVYMRDIISLNLLNDYSIFFFFVWIYLAQLIHIRDFICGEFELSLNLGVDGVVRNEKICYFWNFCHQLVASRAEMYTAKRERFEPRKWLTNFYYSLLQRCSLLLTRKQKEINTRVTKASCLNIKLN